MDNILQNILEGKYLSKEKQPESLSDYLSKSGLDIKEIPPSVISSIYSFITPELLELLSIEFNIELENPKEIETILKEKEIFSSEVHFMDKHIIEIFKSPEVINFIIQKILTNDNYLNIIEDKVLKSDIFNTYLSNYINNYKNEILQNKLETYNTNLYYTSETFNSILNNKIEQLEEKYYKINSNLIEETNSILNSNIQLLNESNSITNQLFNTNILQNLKSITKNNNNLIEELNSIINEKIENEKVENINNISNIFNSQSFETLVSNGNLSEVINSSNTLNDTFNVEMIHSIINENKSHLVNKNRSGDISSITDLFNNVVFQKTPNVVNVSEDDKSVKNIFNNEYLNLLTSLPQEDSNVIIEKHLHNNITNVEHKIQNLKNEIIEMVESKNPPKIEEPNNINVKASKVSNLSDLSHKSSKQSNEPIIRELSPAPRKVSPLPNFPMIGYDF